MLLFSVALVGGVIITGQLAGRALFLSSLPREAIPYKYMLPPLALMLASAAYTRLAPRLRTDRLIAVFCVLSALGMLGFRFLLSTPAGQGLVPLCALFVFIDIVGSLAVVQFWTFASDIFDAREAKRLFGLIAGGSAISNVLFGAVLAGVASRLDPADLLYCLAASLLICAGATLYITGRCRDDLPADALSSPGPVSEPDATSLWDDLSSTLAQPLVRTIGALVLMAALASGIADYLLDLALQREYGSDGQGMVAFLGGFRLLAGLASVVLQFFLAGRLLERFGVVAGLAMLPSMIAMSAGVVLATAGALWAAALPRASDVVLKYTVHDAALNLLYLPIDSARRARAKAVLEGIVKPPVVGLLGISFLLADRWSTLPPQGWAVPLLVVTLLWLLLMRAAARQYVAALTRSLRMRRLDLDAEPLNLSDDSSIRVVRESLRSEDEGRVLHALSLLDQIPNRDFGADLEPLTCHASAQIRQSVLRQMAAFGDGRADDALRAALQDEDLDVRGVAVEELCVAGSASATEVMAFLQSAEPRIRGTAVLGTLRREGLQALHLVEDNLRTLLEDNDPVARAEGVRAVCSLGNPALAAFLMPRLLDADPLVRAAAARGAARMPSPDLIPALIASLDRATLREDAARSIALCGASDLQPIQAGIDDIALPIQTRARLLRLLGSVAHVDVIERLLQQLESGDRRLRLAASQALLERCRAENHLVPSPRLVPLLEAEAVAGYRWNAALDSTHRLPRASLLREALLLRFDETRARVLILLDLLHPELAEDRLRLSLLATTTSLAEGRRSRAAALELLDSVLSHELRALLVPLLSPNASERRAGAQRVGIVEQSAARQLAELQQDDDPWLQRCAHFAAAEPEGEQDMALTTLERVFFLKSVSFFQPIPGEQLDRFASILKEVQFEAGETFIRRGDDGDCLFILVEGEVEIRRDGQVFFAGSTEVIGERSVLTESPRTADCTANTEVVALRIDKDDFWDLMREQPGLTIEVMRVIVDRYVPA